MIWELAVEEPEGAGALLATAHLTALLETRQAQNGLAAWNALIGLAGEAARLRGGYEMAGWLDGLRGKGVLVAAGGATPAAELQRRYEALSRYKCRLRRDGSVIDLLGLGAEVPALPVTEVDAEVQVRNGPDGPGSDADLLWAFLRRGRTILTGLPGGASRPRSECSRDGCATCLMPRCPSECLSPTSTPWIAPMGSATACCRSHCATTRPRTGRSCAQSSNNASTSAARRCS